MAAGEEPPTGGRDVRRWGTRGDPYAEQIKVIADLCGDTGVLGFWASNIICVFDVRVVGSDAGFYDGRHPHKILSQHEWRKKGKYIDSCIQQ